MFYHAILAEINPGSPRNDDPRGAPVRGGEPAADSVDPELEVGVFSREGGDIHIERMGRVWFLAGGLPEHFGAVDPHHCISAAFAPVMELPRSLDPDTRRARAGPCQGRECHPSWAQAGRNARRNRGHFHACRIVSPAALSQTLRRHEAGEGVHCP